MSKWIQKGSLEAPWQTSRNRFCISSFCAASKVVKGNHHQHLLHGRGARGLYENCQVRNIILIWAIFAGRCLRLFLTLFSPGYQSFLCKSLFRAPIASSCVSLQIKRPTQHCDLLVVCPSLELLAPKTSQFIARQAGNLYLTHVEIKALHKIFISGF